MSILNEYFKQFYPKDLLRENFEFRNMLGGMWAYRGPEKASNIFPRIECADGLNFSAQGHCGAYSAPRDDFADSYDSVEIGFPSERVEEFMPYIDGGPDSDPLESVYGWVPTEIVEAVIAKHGGLKSAAATAASREGGE